MNNFQEVCKLLGGVHRDNKCFVDRIEIEHHRLTDRTVVHDLGTDAETIRRLRRRIERTLYEQCEQDWKKFFYNMVTVGEKEHILTEIDDELRKLYWKKVVEEHAGLSREWREWEKKIKKWER